MSKSGRIHSAIISSPCLYFFAFTIFLIIISWIQKNLLLKSMQRIVPLLHWNINFFCFVLTPLKTL